MNVELPDGSVLEDVPEGTSRAAIADRLRKAGRSIPPEWAQPAKPESRNHYVNELGRQLGLTARAGAHAVAGVPAMLADAVTAVIPMSPEFRSKYAQPQSAALDAMMTRMGLPAPADASERVVGDIASSVGGVGAAAKLTAKTPAAVSKLFGDQLGAQALSAGLGTGAGGVTRENDGGWFAQLMASLLAGMSPSALKTANRGLFANTTERGRADTKGKLLNEAAGEQRPAVLDALDAAKRNIPGESPTAAQAASVADSPAFAGVEKLVTQKYRPDLVAARDAENEAARLTAIRSVGKTPAELDKALTVRAKIGSQAYDRALYEGIDPAAAQMMQPQIEELLKRPSIQAAKSTAKDWANERGIVLKDDDYGSPIGLKFLQKAINDRIAHLPPKAHDQKDMLTKTANDLRLTIEQLSPETIQANKVYARLSREPNRMELGQALERKLGDALTGAEKPKTFATAWRDADLLAKKETGFPINLRPDQTSLLGGVKSSLEREARTNEQAQLGTQKARGLLGEIAPLEPPPFLHRAITAARFVLEKVGVSTKNKTLAELAKDMQNPEIAAKLMRESTPSQWAAMKEVMRFAAQPVSAGLLQTTSQLQ